MELVTGLNSIELGRQNFVSSKEMELVTGQNSIELGKAELRQQ